MIRMTNRQVLTPNVQSVTNVKSVTYTSFPNFL